MKPTAYILAAITTLALAHLGLPKVLGAHPFWATKIAWVGVPIGLITALALHRIGKAKRLVLFALFLSQPALRRISAGCNSRRPMPKTSSPGSSGISAGSALPPWQPL